MNFQFSSDHPVQSTIYNKKKKITKRKLQDKHARVSQAHVVSIIHHNYCKSGARRSAFTDGLYCTVELAVMHHAV